MVFQDPTGTLNPRQTIYEIIAEGLRIHGIDRGPNGEPEEQLVARALSRAGLRPPDRFFLRYPHELSGGQRQRVVIAGALVLEPEVIVADEPVSNLDASVRGEILQLLMKLREDLDLTIVIVTHDLGLAWTVADRVAVMYLGRIVEIGPAEEVLLRPLHPYTKALLDVVPEAGGLDRPILTGEPPRPDEDPRRDAGSTHGARSWSPGRRPSSGSRQACKGEDLALEEINTGHLAACHASRQLGARRRTRRSLRSRRRWLPEPIAEIPAGSADAQDERRVARCLSLPDLGRVALGRLGALEHAEDRFHLGVRDLRVVRHVLRPGGGAAASAGSIRPSPRDPRGTARARRGRGRAAPPRRDPGARRETPRGPDASRRAGWRPLSEFEQPVHHRAAEIGVGGRPRGRRRLRPMQRPSSRAASGGARPTASRSPGSTGRSSRRR